MAVLRGTNIKDQLVQQVAEDLKQPENVVDKVITHQFKHANQAMKLYSQVEISGFGKFEQSQAKIKRRIQKKEEIRDALQKKTPEELLTNNYQRKLSGVLAELEFYYSRLK
jgi:nucleoid DNA-binding protein